MALPERAGTYLVPRGSLRLKAQQGNLDRLHSLKEKPGQSWMHGDSWQTVLHCHHLLAVCIK